MISDNNTNLNLSYHPPNPCLLLLPRSLILSPPLPFPSPYPYASTYIHYTFMVSDDDDIKMVKWGGVEVGVGGGVRGDTADDDSLKALTCPV